MAYNSIFDEHSKEFIFSYNSEGINVVISNKNYDAGFENIKQVVETTNKLFNYFNGFVNRCPEEIKRTRCKQYKYIIG